MQNECWGVPFKISYRILAHILWSAPVLKDPKDPSGTEIIREVYVKASLGEGNKHHNEGINRNATKLTTEVTPRRDPPP